MALAAGIEFRFDARRAVVPDHFPPDIPKLFRILVKICLFESTEQIKAHRYRAFRIAFLRNALFQIPPSLFFSERPCQDTEHLAMLAAHPAIRTFHVCGSVCQQTFSVHTDASDCSLHLLRPLAVSCSPDGVTRILLKLGGFLQAENIQQALHCDRTVQACPRHSRSFHPLLRPVNERPQRTLFIHTACLSDQPLKRTFSDDSFFKKVQDPANNRKHRFYKLRITEIHHMVMHHQYVIQRKARNHIDRLIRIAAVQQSVRPLCP